MTTNKPTKEDMKIATKYITILAGAVVAVGLSAYAVMPYAHQNLSENYPEAYTVVFYYPIYALAIIVVAGYHQIKKDRAKKTTSTDATPAS